MARRKGGRRIPKDMKTKDFWLSQAAGTGSMRPGISDAAQLIVIKPDGSLKIGDIIAFKCQGQNNEIGRAHV